jgi:starvation-inducible DNA-binding protein
MNTTISPKSKAAIAANRTAKTAVSPIKGNSANGVSSTRSASFTAPSLTSAEGIKVAAQLQQRLVSLIDLALTLKHIHWNVVGPNFISVHMMLDPQHDGVETMVDDVAERIATLGGVPLGLPGRIVDARTWTDYSLDRADALSHLGALDLVYTGVIENHRSAIDTVGDIDAVSQDLLIGQTGVLERYQWFVRSHLADYAGGMANAGASSELGAASAVSAKSRRNGNSPKRSASK